MISVSSEQLTFFFLAEGEQSAGTVMSCLTDFIAEAKQTLDLAFYDMRLTEPLKEQFSKALQERASAGVKVRICFDGDKPLKPNLAAGQDPAPSGTSALVQSLGFPWRRIGGMKLMHHKFIVRDRASVWTGSLNLTDDAFTLMENNVVQIHSSAVASSYVQDFEQLWAKESFEDTGQFKTLPATLEFFDHPATVSVMFSPGCGLTIDQEIERRIAAAQTRIRICSLLINSGTLINALLNILRGGKLAVNGIYDRTQMADVYRQWQEVPSNRWKIPALHEVIDRAGLVGKDSTPYTPAGRHDFMHNKILLVDDTVITGSYNFSRSAQLNAENIVFIQSRAAADSYSSYIDHLLKKYGNRPT